MRFRPEPEITLKNNYILVEVKVIGIQGKKKFGKMIYGFGQAQVWRNLGPALNSREVRQPPGHLFHPKPRIIVILLILGATNEPKDGLLAPE